MIAFLYPGQGSQFVGMCMDFYFHFDKARKLLDEANEILGINITRIMFNGPDQELKETKNAQVAIFLHSMVVSSLLFEEGIVPNYIAGHSLGEHSALVIAGVISLGDGLKLIRLRGELMTEAGIHSPGKMAAIIGLSFDRVNEICKNVSSNNVIVNIANHNTSSQVVVSGESEGVRNVCEIAINSGAKRVVFLPVSGAFHSSLMEEAQQSFQNVLENIKIREPEFPIVTNTSAEVIFKKEKIKEELRNTMLSPVRWFESMQRMYELGIDTFVEVGPGKILKGLLLEIDRKRKVFSTFDVKQFHYTMKGLKS
ncbi:MAG: ACP S-malonyltransferase [Candidatus Helarchaeota archaeon]|nr:ACP S-malonyltransferase [Candidatus Helarchaeota archaeon]